MLSFSRSLKSANTDMSGSSMSKQIVFFDGVGHVGLYVGHGRFIHSPHAGATVQISSMRSSWGYSFNGARRIVAGATRRLLNG